MAEIITCPDCRRKLQLPEELMGQSVRCPSCGAEFVASVDGPPPPQPPQYGGAGYEELPSREPTPSPPQPQSQSYSYDAPNYSSSYENDYRGESPRRRGRRYHEPHRGSLILTLGILSFFVAGPILGPIAWVMGTTDLREIQAGRMDPDGEEQTNAGRICGMISTIIHIVILVSCCLIMGMMVVAGGARGFR